VYARSKSIDEIKARAGPFDFETVFHLHYDRVARIIARVVGEPARAEELAVDVSGSCGTRRGRKATASVAGSTAPQCAPAFMNYAADAAVHA
jgi:hypothetical protein